MVSELVLIFLKNGLLEIRHVFLFVKIVRRGYTDMFAIDGM